MGTLPERLRRQVRERAQGHCEYCGVADAYAYLPHEPDHIIAEKHAGPTTEANLAWACFLCNRHKGSDISSIDPISGHIVPLYHPRKQQWKRHFRLNGLRIEPLTASARATAFLLQLNTEKRIEDRRDLMAAGRYP